MNSDDFAEEVRGVAVLAEPVRRDLFLYVAAQPEPVSRDQASEGVGVARHAAKFHLDKLVEEGLLDAEFRRVSGRQGPGAGRPSKLYKRSAREVSVTLPERRYDLAGQLMARAIDDSVHHEAGVVPALHAAAADVGYRLGEQVSDEVGARPSRERLLSSACATVAAHGYAPRRESKTVTLANCPFDALARDHTALICGMNLALLGAFANRAAPGRLSARLDPAPSRCCVVLSTG